MNDLDGFSYSIVGGLSKWRGQVALASACGFWSLSWIKPRRLKPALLKNRASSGIAVDRGMAHVASRDHVDHVFGDVRGVVGDAFEIFGHQDEFKRGKYHGRIAHHVAEQLAEDLVTELVHRVVAREHRAGQFDIAAHQGVEA